MSVPVLEAVSFQREMSTGRTKPCVFICESDDRNICGEYVVKLKAGVDNGTLGLVSELVASRLASYFDMCTPAPALIRIDTILADAVPKGELATKIRNSVGLNFGSTFLCGGYETWPVGKSVSLNLRPSAAEIFAFDALIQNPDRRQDKPNVLWKGDEIYVIDHELGFSFLYEIGPKPDPWRITELDFLQSHLFYGKLRGQPLSFDRFAGVLEALSAGGAIATILGVVPKEWRTSKIESIGNHLTQICSHANDFIDELRRILS